MMALLSINHKTFAVLFTLVAIFAAVAFPVLSASLAEAQSSLVCEGLDAATNEFCSDADSTPGINGLIETALNVLSIVAGVAGVIMLVLGGAKYITSQGDPSSANSARNTIIYAIVGLVIVAVAQTIVFFAINQATDISSPPPSCVTLPC